MKKVPALFVVFCLTLILAWESSGQPGRPSGKGGFKGGGIGMGGMPGGGGTTQYLMFILKDPESWFKFRARDRDFFLISESKFQSSKDDLEAFAKERGITDGKITREHIGPFTDFLKSRYKIGESSDPKVGKTEGTKEGGGKISNEDFADFDFKNRDRNEDGQLNLDEMPDSLRKDLDRWDKDGDKLISPSEYRPYFLARQQERERERQGTPNIIVEEDLDKKPVIFRAGKLPENLPSWFKEFDKDGDGQIALAEWRREAVANKGKEMKEFQDMDLNDDGLLTAEEVLYFMNGGSVFANNSKTGSRPPGGMGKGGPNFFKKKGSR